MRSFKIVFFLLFVILLLAACSDEPTISVTFLPLETTKPSAAAAVSDVIPDPLISPVSSAELNDESNVTPEISDADISTYNPDKITVCLDECPLITHERTIKQVEIENGTVYISVFDYMYSDSPTDVFNYLKDQLSMSEEDILDLPVFSELYMYEGYIVWDMDGDPSIEYGTDYTAPLADNVQISLFNEDTCDIYEVTLQQFKDEFLNGKSENSVDIRYVDLTFANGSVTSIKQRQDSEN